MRKNELLHALWGKAVNTQNYNKEEWKELEKILLTPDKKYEYGSITFYNLLEHMAELHNNKSHDYASNDNPFENYHFAGKMSQLFKNSDDAGFMGRIGEKIFRLANLENNNKNPKNESIEDTELDICVIFVLWMSSRINRRKS